MIVPIKVKKCICACVSGLEDDALTNEAKAESSDIEVASLKKF